MPKSELEKLEDKLDRLTYTKDAQAREIRRLRAAALTRQDLLEKFETELTTIQKLVSTPIKGPVVKKPKKSTKEHHATQLLHFSDAQYFEVIKPKAVNWATAYDPEIASLRTTQMVDSFCNLSMDFTNSLTYDAAVIVSNGDVISGAIHQELAVTDYGPPADAIVFAAREYMKVIDTALLCFPEVILIGLPGNHDRDGGPGSKTPHKNRAQSALTWVLYHHLLDRYRDEPRVTIHISESAEMKFDIYGTRFHAEHGDNLSAGSSANHGALYNKVYQATQKRRTRDAALGEYFDHALYGHMHTLTDGLGFSINGSLPGYGEYPFHFAMGPQVPLQGMMTVTPERGITTRTGIQCFSSKETWWKSAPKTRLPYLQAMFK